MKAIILAAGIGRRLYPFTKTTPKCLLEVEGKTLIERSLDALSENGIREVVIVVGYLEEQIISRIGSSYRDLVVKYVENTSYSRTGSMYSLLFAKKEMDGDFIYLDADLLFHSAIIKKSLESKKKNIIVFGPLSGNSGEEVKVYVDKGFATKIGKDIKTTDKCVGEAVGIVKYSKTTIPSLIFEMEKLFSENDKAEHEDLTQKMCNLGVMEVVSTGNLQWIEIDFPEDVDKARNKVWRSL